MRVRWSPVHEKNVRLCHAFCAYDEVFCLPKLQSLFLCPGQVDKADDVLMKTFHLLLYYSFLGLDKSLLKLLLLLRPQKESDGVKSTVCRPSFLSFPPAISPA